ncbi:Copia protein [Porphyridium purpureum]|uniref:Copia protein n=1 Tax=Porphyridium purpureum TaxID=35688 RepID=A0A5J4YKD3_PORPP|nr:Copia protein [Porphyridium purpureum]|eukprot:POR9519..scf210_14
MTIALHVDDVLITAASENDIDKFLQDVSHDFDNVESHRGRKLNYLGMILDFATRGVLKIRMPGCIDSILEDARVTTSRPTPADANIFVVTKDADLLHGEKKNAYHSMAICGTPKMASHTGAAVSLRSGTITAKSSKQKALVKNSTEAEILAVSDAIGAALWLTNFLREQGHQCDAPVLLQDNQSAIAMMRRGRPHSARARHMHIRHFFVHDLIQRSELQVEHCGTQYMVSDILTKPLQGSQFRRLGDQLLGYQPFHEGNAPTAAQPGGVSRNNEGEQVQSSPVHTGVLELGESSEVETATGDRGLLLLDSHPSDYLSRPPSRETVLS